MIKLSIAIPSYNGALCIEKRAFASIIPQVEKAGDRVDILVSDNASTDGLKEVVKSYQKIYPFIRYSRNEKNVGLDRNFDAAVKKSSGEYVWLFSDDDIMEEGALEKVLSILDANPDLSAVFVNYGKKPAMLKEDFLCKTGDDYMERVCFKNNLVSSNIVKKSVWKAIDASKYYDTTWIHMGVLHEALAKKKSYVISHPYVKQGAAIETRWGSNGARWGNEGSFINSGPVLVNMLKQMDKYGYDPRILKRCIGRIIRDEALVYIPMAKVMGLKVDRNLLKKFYESYSVFPAFWLMSLPALIIPGLVYRTCYRLVYPVRRKIKATIIR
jgi:glycosyltransferase involved in cell wall biosynthesis